MGVTGIVLGAAAAYKSYKASKKKRKEAKRLEGIQAGIRGRATGYASPEHYQELLDAYREEFSQGYLPQLRSMADMIGLGEQAEQQRWQSAIGKRNLSGSGVDYFGKRSIAGGRQARLSKAKTAYDIDVERGARGQAGRTQAGQISTELGSPVPFVEQSSKGADIAGAVMSGVSTGTGYGADAGYGGGGWESWFRKPKQASAANKPAWGQTYM